MQSSIKLSTHLASNIHLLKELLPIGTSFDLITRNLYLRDTPAFFLGVNGFCKTDILQQIFSDLQKNSTLISFRIYEDPQEAEELLQGGKLDAGRLEFT